MSARSSWILGLSLAFAVGFCLFWMMHAPGSRGHVHPSRETTRTPLAPREGEVGPSTDPIATARYRPSAGAFRYLFVRKSGGAPVSGVSVVVDDTVIGVSDSEGAVSLKPGGPVVVVHRDYQPLVLERGQSGETRRVELSSGATISGTVSAPGLKQAPQAVVIARRGGVGRGQTADCWHEGTNVHSVRRFDDDETTYEKRAAVGADGRFEFRDLSPGPHHLSVRAFGFASSSVVDGVGCVAPCEVDFELRPVYVSYMRIEKGIGPIRFSAMVSSDGMPRDLKSMGPIARSAIEQEVRAMIVREIGALGDDAEDRLDLCVLREGTDLNEDMTYESHVQVGVGNDQARRSSVRFVPLYRFAPRLDTTLVEFSSMASEFATLAVTSRSDVLVSTDESLRVRYLPIDQTGSTSVFRVVPGTVEVRVTAVDSRGRWTVAERCSMAAGEHREVNVTSGLKGHGRVTFRVRDASGALTDSYHLFIESPSGVGDMSWIGSQAGAESTQLVPVGPCRVVVRDAKLEIAAKRDIVVDEQDRTVDLTMSWR